MTPTRAFLQRCGLKAFPVEADTGVIGGNFSHEFMVPAETGENEVVFLRSLRLRGERRKGDQRHSQNRGARNRRGRLKNLPRRAS